MILVLEYVQNFIKTLAGTPMHLHFPLPGKIPI